MDDLITIAAPGTQVTTGAASAVVAIPADATGQRARVVRLQALATCYVRPGFATSLCTSGDILLTPNEALYLNVRPFTHLAHLQETAAARFSISPVEF